MEKKDRLIFDVARLLQKRKAVNDERLKGRKKHCKIKMGTKYSKGMYRLEIDRLRADWNVELKNNDLIRAYRISMTKSQAKVLFQLYEKLGFASIELVEEQ